MTQPYSFQRIIIGTMRLGAWGAQMSTDELEAFIEACVTQLGLTDFDLADIYGSYTTEGEIGQVLKRRPDLKQRMRLTTKCGIKLVAGNRPEHRLKSYDSSPGHIIRSVEQSLKDLNVEQLDVLLLHRPDHLMDVEAVAKTFEQLKAQEKVNHFGVSNFSTSQVALLHQYVPLVTNQVEYSIIHPGALHDGTFNQCRHLNIAATCWSPLGGGRLFAAKQDQQVVRIRKACQPLCERYDATIDQVLLAWIFKHPAGISAVIGTSDIDRVRSAKAALNIDLTHEEWYGLLEASTGEEVP